MGSHLHRIKDDEDTTLVSGLWENKFRSGAEQKSKKKKTGWPCRRATKKHVRRWRRF